jgi:nucleoside-diphosphate-sugar epimerase
MKTTIIGCGYLGCQVAEACLRDGERVVGVVRSEERARALQARGIEPLRADLDRPPLSGVPLAGSALYYFVAPNPEGEGDSRIDALLSALDAAGNPARIVYLSTTGVYGNCHGEWIDESRRPEPVVPRALRRWQAEETLREWCESAGVELVILRVAGFYGPGRLPLERLRQQLPMVREAEAPFSNRIHVADLVAVCRAAMRQGGAGEIYNVSDGHPTTMTDYFDRIADLGNLPRPRKITLRQAEAELSPGMLSYMRESRRLRNDKMLRELEVELRYPTLEEGLPAALTGS